MNKIGRVLCCYIRWLLHKSFICHYQ